MFTGLIAELGRLRELQRREEGVRLMIAAALAGELAVGDSVAVNGVCLTATEVEPGAFAAEVMNETLARSSLGSLEPGAEVNLELPLRATDRLGGHIVQGHVDALGAVLEAAPDGFARRLRIEAPAALMRYVVPKGSIAIDGVSLTVAGCEEASFTVSLIPETLERTNLSSVGAGARVNLEADVLAKYVEKAVKAT